MAEELPRAARIKDKIKHTWAWEGALWGLVTGILIGIAVAAFILLVVVTGPIGVMAVLAALSVACCISVAISQLAEFAGEWIPHHNQGEIAKGAMTVFTGAWDLNAARANDEVACKQHGTRHIAQGSETVSIENEPAARVDDKTDCDGEIESGCETVAIGGPKGTFREIEDEMAFHGTFGWIRWTIDIVGVVAGLICGIGEIKGAFFALKNWKVFGQGASLLMAIAAKIAEKTGNETLAKWIERAKVPLDVAMGLSDVRKIFKDAHEITDLTREANELRQDAKTIQAVTGDAERAAKLQHELDAAEKAGFMSRAEKMEEANHGVKKAVDAYQHEPANVVGSHGQAIDHMGRDLPPTNPQKIITSPNEPVVPSETPKLFTGEPTPPPNAGQPLIIPGQATPPPPGTHIIFPP